MPRRFETVAEQREYWRTKSRRYYYANLDRVRATQERYRRRLGIRTREESLRLRPILHCLSCGDVFQRPVKSQQRYCSHDCRWRARRIRSRHPVCRVWFTSCIECGRPFAARRFNAKRCSATCKQAHVNASQRDSAREYQRRTRYTAIRYWAVDTSPEALAVAAIYYELRQELRRVRHP
jgi:hypothetical protein